MAVEGNTEATTAALPSGPASTLFSRVVRTSQADSTVAMTPRSTTSRSAHSGTGRSMTGVRADAGARTPGSPATPEICAS